MDVTKMNNKERALWQMLDNAIKCCAVLVDEDGELSITRADILGKSRAENLVMTRCIAASQMHRAGYSTTTIARLMCRTVPAIRHLLAADLNYTETSRAYRIAAAETTLMNKGLEPCGL